MTTITPSHHSPIAGLAIPDTVKLDVDTLATVPAVPPAARADRAFDAADPAFAAGRVLAPAEPLLEVALTIPRRSLRSERARRR
jgi:hypothetical protein